MSTDQPYIYPQDSRTVPFSANDFGSQWALFRGRVFEVNDLAPFYREWEEWLAAHDSRVSREEGLCPEHKNNSNDPGYNEPSRECVKCWKNRALQAEERASDLSSDHQGGSW